MLFDGRFRCLHADADERIISNNVNRKMERIG